MTAIPGAPQSQHHVPTAAASLAAAKSRFMDAVRRGIEDLMNQCGYSRERATSTLLRELGRGDVPPNADEVFDTMIAFGLGEDDAAQALTVARAVRRAMNERGMTAVEAIDDLSSKLHITKLVASPPGNDEPGELSPLSTSRPSSPEQRAAPTPTSVNSDRVSTQPRKGKKVNGKTSHNNKNGKQKSSKGHHNSKNQSRKRSAPGSDEPKQQDVKFPPRERADSVAEAVEAKAKKARLSSLTTPEESKTSDAAADTALPSGSNGNSNPIMVRRSKRNAAHRGEQDAQSANTV